MALGYMGRLLLVDLTSETISTLATDDSTVRGYLGGSGLGMRLLAQYAKADAPPLSPDNPLIFVAGLLTGTPVPTACKVSVCTKSPLTGLWTEATVGGFWGARLKGAGYDGIVVLGRSARPVYLWVNEDKVELRSAANIWGKDTYATSDALRDETTPDAEVASIGPAGERLVKIASIMVGGSQARAAGRTGVGAVMGAKNLKAIVVAGSQRPDLADRKGLIEAIKSNVPTLKQYAKMLSDFGTAGGVMAVEASGDLPIRNWTLGSWSEGAARTCGQRIAESAFVEHYGCFACPIRCGKSVRIDRGPFAGTVAHGPEYETAAGFGAMVLNDDLSVLLQANDLCNRYGLDTISTASTIAFAVEAFERGQLTIGHTGGRSLTWGDAETIISLINDIAFREGVGDLLAEGTKEAAARIGGNAIELAIQVKGLEIAFHDPRAFTSMAVGYATANRGGCHLEQLTYFAEGPVFPPAKVGFEKPIEPHGQDNKAELAIRMQNFMEVFNALGLCKFLMRGRVGPEELAAWVNGVMGWSLTANDIMATGERLFNFKRWRNTQLGVSRKDDMLPMRLLTLDRKTGGAAGSLPHLGKMLGEYYELRGWSETGIPSRQKLAELDIE